jgi:hypothetical protein
MAISPHDPKTIYYGGNYLFESTDCGDNRVRLAKDLTTGQDRNKIAVTGKMLSRETFSSTMAQYVAVYHCHRQIACARRSRWRTWRARGGRAGRGGGAPLVEPGEYTVTLPWPIRKIRARPKIAPSGGRPWIHW